MASDDRRPLAPTLFDVIAVLAKVFWVAVGAAMIAATVAAVMQLTLLRSHSSEATIQMTPREVLIIRSDDLWRRAMVTAGQAATAASTGHTFLTLPRMEARMLPIGGGDLLPVDWYHISVADRTPARAQAVLTAVLATLTEMTTPNAVESSWLLRRRMFFMELQSELRSLLGGLAARMVREPEVTDPAASRELATAVTQAIRTLERSHVDNELRIEGFGAGRMVEPPSLPHDSLPEDLVRNAGLAALTASFVVFLVALLSDAVTRAAAYPGQSEKLERIRGYLRLSRRPRTTS